MKIALLHNRVFDINSLDEQDTLAQRDFINSILIKLGYDTVEIPCDLNLFSLREKLEKIKPDLVFNLVESLNGKGRFIQFVPTILEEMRIPFTGSSAEALFFTSNKLYAKKIFRQHKLPTPIWFEDAGLTKKSTKALTGKVIIKAVWEHASIGLDHLSILAAKDVELIKQCIREKQQKFGDIYFVEEYIPGREFNVSILEGPNGPEVLPIAEIVFEGFDDKPAILTYQAKWDVSSSDYQNSNRSFVCKRGDQKLQDKLKKISSACWEVLKLKGYARVDFRVDEKNIPYVLEVNANPCLAPDAGFIAAAEKAGLTQEQVIERIVNAARN